MRIDIGEYMNFIEDLSPDHWAEDGDSLETVRGKSFNRTRRVFVEMFIPAIKQELLGVSSKEALKTRLDKITLVWLDLAERFDLIEHTMRIFIEEKFSLDNTVE